jgi:hypothetical protein
MLAEAEQRSCDWRMLSQLNELRATHFDSTNAAHTKLLVQLMEEGRTRAAAAWGCRVGPASG